MTFALHKVSIAVIKHCHQEQLGGGKCFFHLSSHKLFTERTWEKFKAEPWIEQLEAEAMEEHLVLILLPWRTQFAFLDNSGSPA